MIQKQEIHIRKSFWSGLLSSFLVLALASLASTVEVGQKAPDFSLMSTTGKPIRLSEFVGRKYVVLEFYVSDFAEA